MSSIEEIRSSILSGNELLSEAQGFLQAARAKIDEAQGVFLRASEGSAQGDVTEAAALLAQASASCGESSQVVSAALQSSEGVANRL
jgi:hypothetical protein